MSGPSPFTDSIGRTWSPDVALARGGTLRVRPDQVAGASNQELYRTARFGQTGYDIPLANGTYTVRLNMDEPYWTKAGQRRFDILAQGVLAASDVDIFRAVGPFRAYQVSFTVAVRTSMLKIDFGRRVDNPIVDSLSVEPKATPPSPVDPPQPVPANYVTPESFGAVGNGVTDDTAALQRAFDGAAGRTVLLTSGRV